MPPKLPAYSSLHAKRGVYQPSEDSFLLLDAIATLESITPALIIDCGTGSGVLAASLCQKFPQAQVLAIDLSPEAVLAARDTLHRVNSYAARSEVVRMNLLSNVISPGGHGSVDLIVYNPPYVPSDGFTPTTFADLAWCGGEDGCESTHPLVKAAASVLRPKTGILLLLLEARNNIEEFLSEYTHVFAISLLMERRISGERLCVYKMIRR